MTEPLRILMVEDDAFMVQALTHMLGKTFPQAHITANRPSRG